LPVLAISLGQINSLLRSNTLLKLRHYLALTLYLSIIAATLFLFYIQAIKNGMAYATLCILLFAFLLFFRYPSQWWRKGLLAIALVAILAVALSPHIQENQTWRTLIADTKVAFQIDKYPHWQYPQHDVYPNNEFGVSVSGTTYLRAAWFNVGVRLALQTPLGYGLVEDSFKKMAKVNWPEASPNLSHSHSGWLDVILALGFPGFLCILGALGGAIWLSGSVIDPWRLVIFWSLAANLMLWVTTEVSATVSFAVLIFWICWASGLTLIRSYPKIPPS
jgi:O-antigen ligase